MSFAISSHRKPAALATFIMVFAFGLGVARAGIIDGSVTGLTSPAETISFGEIILPVNTSVTTQYSGLGVSFSPNVYYDPQAYGSFVNDVGNFTFPSEPAYIDPVVMSFSTPQTGVAFQMTADSTPYLFQAFLGGTGGTLVDSFTDANIGDILFYGFSNETFDTIKISEAGAGGGPYWLIDNIQLGTGTAVPEPSSILLMGPAMAGLWLARRGRFARPGRSGDPR